MHRETFEENICGDNTQYIYTGTHTTLETTSPDYRSPPPVVKNISKTKVLCLITSLYMIQGGPDAC